MQNEYLYGISHRIAFQILRHFHQLYLYLFELVKIYLQFYLYPKQFLNIHFQVVMGLAFQSKRLSSKHLALINKLLCFDIKNIYKY